MMRIPLSFKNTERDLYNFLKEKRCPSCYVKNLLEKEMLKEKGSAEKDTSNTQEFEDSFDF